MQHHDAIDAAIEAWTRERTPAEVEALLQARGVPAAAMRRGNDIAQTAEWQRILKPLGDGEQSVGLPFSFRGTAPAALTPAPRVGADSDDVVRDWLGS
jgi:crotonobetainyl-CoA:carnitine CoA-transferase CaiB-like acyl-CoA transferase